MCQYRVKYFLLIVISILSFNAYGQTNTFSNPTAGRENDPYTRFGLGQPLNGNNTVLQGMGNISSAYENPYEVNSDNPASYSFLRFTTYSAGAQASQRTVATSDQSYSTGTATLSYLNIGVPVGRHAGLSFGLRPQSRVYYNLVDTVFTPYGKTQKLFSGDGGLNYAYVGAAYNYKGFSLGFNLGYMFGTTRYSSEANGIDTQQSSRNIYNSEFSQYNKIGGIYWKGGLLYEGKLNKKLTFRAGGTLTISQNIDQTIENYGIGYYQFADTLMNDTAYSNTAKGKITLPTSFSLGFQIANNDKWEVGIDYTGSQWSQYRNFGSVDSNISSNAYKISIGGDYTPNATNSRSYWSRVTYRAGLYYGTDYINIQNTQLQYYGFTVGASLPFRRSPSHFHVAFDLERYGTKSNGLLEETIAKFTLGISFTDRWFIKRKYE